jgi:uncharacterized protein
MKKEIDIVEEVRKFVENESQKSSARYGHDFYTFHLIPMYNYAKKLSEEKKADTKTVELAALLHDIGAIIYGRENHHITGARVAEDKLRELGCSEEQIERVKNCIVNHRGSVNLEKKIIEEQIIADADAISTFDNIPGIFKAAFVYEKQHQIQAKESAKQKLENCWKKLSLKESKKLIRPKYEAAMLLLT